ncbi:MAG: DNA polymerase III subunit beta [Bacilli bacterium]|nr:DNA polymerase III subunit beta [Bacilli bacterium]
MKLLIERNEILGSLTNVMRAISPRNIIPILNGVRFDLTKEGLYLTASDSDLTIKTIIPKEKIKNIEKTGSIIIQSKYLLEIIRKLPNTDINIEVVDGLKIIISTENTIFNLNCLNLEDYPHISLEEIKKPIIIESKDLKNIINQTIFAVSTQESRPLLTGINFKVNGNILECIATDSYRLAKKTFILSEEYESFDLVIPGKNINELDKLLSLEGNVEIHPFINKILFKYDNYSFQSNLLSGSYPNTSNLIPTDFEIILTTTLSEYYHAIDRAALLTQNKDKNIVKMETAEKTLMISSYASEIGKVEETVTINKNDSKDLSISFSSKYMLEALKTFEEEELLILLNTDTKPIILKSTKDESLIQLILPIKTY